jgi:transposase InsO family protein
MAFFNKHRGIKGFVTAYDHILRFKYMISEIAKERLKILSFFEKHGLEATTEAFNISRATIFRWQKAFRQSKKQISSLNKQSTKPKNLRRRIIDQKIIDFIINERKYDKQLSKDKLSILMKEDGLANISPSTVGRILNDLKRKGILPNPKKLSYYARTDIFREKSFKKRKKLRSKHHKGTLVKADSVVRFCNGIKRYIVTAIDTESKFCFAYAYKNHSSDSTTDFMKKLKQVAPVEITHIQTDNGSEFEKHFHLYLSKNNIVHFNTYPRCPKQNTEVERFNRTLSDAFIKANIYLLAYDIDAFNEKLIDWLLWYNTRRPHWSLGLISPMRYIYNTLPEKSHMWWTNTQI